MIRDFSRYWANLQFQTPDREIGVDVEGNAQDPGYAAGNDQLSVLRASAVAAELHRQGIPSRLLTVVGNGSDRLRVKNTAADPINRIVWIIAR
jgi:outer membrane protein OmpA-like peptidoglycan-associated protein